MIYDQFSVFSIAHVVPPVPVDTQHRLDRFTTARPPTDLFQDRAAPSVLDPSRRFGRLGLLIDFGLSDLEPLDHDNGEVGDAVQSSMSPGRDFEASQTTATVGTPDL